MHALNRFEANLLSILYAVLGDTSIGLVLPRVQQKQAYAGCLSRQVVALVENALSKGMTHWLASIGGWQSDRFLRGDKPVSGAIWQRTPPGELGLSFSAASLKFLIWLTANDPLETSADPWTEMQELTVGDQLLLFRTLQRLLGTEVGQRWFLMSKFASLPLVALSYPDLICERLRLRVPEFDRQLPELAWTLECMQPFLVQRWIEIEQGKGSIAAVDRLERLGATQTALLEAFLQAVERAGRRDLARFLLVALQRLVLRDVAPEQWARTWISSLRLDGMRLSQRTNVYRSASSFWPSPRACIDGPTNVDG